MSLVDVCVTPSVSITVVINRETRRFRIFRRWKMDGCSPGSRVAACVSKGKD
jgi:hypothetical protein